MWLLITEIMQKLNMKKQKINISKFRKFKTLTAAGIFSLGISVGFVWEEFMGIGIWESHEVPTSAYNVCFTPPSGCARLLAKEIHKAKHNIYVQAFDFTSDIIARSLIDAKRRGVKVEILVDRQSKNSVHSKVADFKKAGIKVLVDRVSGIAHNKVMVLDHKKVVTGSYNFTTGADNRNAENLMLIEDKFVANTYYKNWMSRRDVSVEF
jgi:phospholipase D